MSPALRKASPSPIKAKDEKGNFILYDTEETRGLRSSSSDDDSYVPSGSESSSVTDIDVDSSSEEETGKRDRGKASHTHHAPAHAVPGEGFSRYFNPFRTYSRSESSSSCTGSMPSDAAPGNNETLLKAATRNNKVRFVLNLKILSFFIQAILSLVTVAYCLCWMAVTEFDDTTVGHLMPVLSFVLGVWLPNPSEIMKDRKEGNERSRNSRRKRKSHRRRKHKPRA